MQTSIYPKNQINVGKNERAASLFSGGALILMALLRPSRLTFPLALTGGYLLYRGASGNCLVYEAMGINRAGLGGNTGIKVESLLTIEKPRDEVYRFWRNFENFPRFMTHLQAVKVERGEGTKERSHWVAKAPLEQSVEWEAEIYDEVPDEMIAWRSLPGSEFENSGIVRFKDAPGGRGTVVDVSLRYNPIGGSASAAIARLLGEEPAMQVRDDLRRFKEVMETGETATVEGQTSIRIEQVEKEREEILRRKKTDIVQEASEESFPASDAPAWTVDPEV